MDNWKLESLRGYAYPSSPAANFRLVVGSSLPGDVSKVIYLDADLLIQRDIFELWEQDMQDKIVLAVQDSYIQKLPARYVPARARKADQPYFNSGVMVIDLELGGQRGLNSVAWKLPGGCRIEPNILTSTY